MPLPDEYRAAQRKTEYFAALRDDVISHERRIAQLREEIRLAQEEVELHEVVLDLARNDQLIAAIGELYEDSALTSTFASDPDRHCREGNIPLPEGVTLRPLDTEGPSPRLTAHVRRGTWDMEVVWDREIGFFVRPYVNAAAVSGARQE
jgi:hypothetical protein